MPIPFSLHSANFRFINDKQLIYKNSYYLIILQTKFMFVAEALADFSQLTMKGPEVHDKAEENQQKQQNPPHEKIQKQASGQIEKQIKSAKRDRTQQQNRQLEQYQQEDDQKQQQKEPAIQYSEFKQGDKILVKETYENGWWLGHPVGKPELQGFFPSNYVKLGIKPPAPKPKSSNEKKEEEAIPEFDANQGTDWLKKELDEIKTGPVKSDYYQGIKGYKMVKIDEKNQNILKGNHVQFDVATGLARVPVKDQAPTAKAVRQMGYYFDYHQWNEEMNKNPHQKARPDPKKKKPKRLHLKMMD